MEEQFSAAKWGIEMVNNTQAYKMAIIDLRTLLGKIGRHEFRAYGYAKQLRAYRLRVGPH